MDDFPVPDRGVEGGQRGGVAARYGLPVVIGLAGVVAVWLAGPVAALGLVTLVGVWVSAVLLVVGMWVSARQTTNR